MLDLISLISSIVIVVSCIITVLGLVKYKSLQKIIKIFCIYFIVSTLVDVMSWIAASNSINNLFFFHFFAIFEFVLLTIYFQKMYALFNAKANLIPWFLGFCIVLLLGNSLFLQKIDQFNSYSLTFVSAIMIIYCLYAFKLMIDMGAKLAQNDSVKWITVSIFLMHSVSLLVVLFSNQISGFSTDSQMIIWSFRAILILLSKLILLYVFVSLFLNKKQTSKISN